MDDKKLCIRLEDKGGSTPNLILMTNLDLGTILVESKEEQNIIPLFANLKAIVDLTRENLIITAASALRKTKKRAESQKLFEELLEQYVKVRIAELAGVCSLPIIREQSGNFRGFSSEYEVVVYEKDPLEAAI